MLGEKIGEFSGRTTGTRVPVFKVREPIMEVSFEEAGKLFGVDCNDRGTYTAVLQPSGSLLGSGQGVTMTRDGEILTWTGHGRGRPTGRGAGASWRGCLFYETASQKLARLNGLCVAFEYEVDDNGVTHSVLYEWR